MDFKELGYQDSLILFQDLADIVPVTISLPEPPNRNKILNLKRPDSEQKFERTELPKHFNILPKVDQEKFIFQEWDRRINGYWFMNNGKLTWITGTHYLYVNWWKTKWGRPIFCFPEWKYFIHWNHRLYDSTSYGICEMSGRQVTKSSRAGIIMYDLTSRHKNFHAGIQSKNDDDGFDFFSTKIVYGWRNLPQFFKPKSESTSNPKADLVFAESASRAKDAYMQLMTDELSSRIDYRAATNWAYDSTTLNLYVGDEEGKADEEIDVMERWEIVRQAMYDKQHNRIRGKSIHTTTVEKMDKKGGKQWRKLWNASSLIDSDGKSQLNELGQTPSGLHQHFTPAFEWGNYDNYGFPDIEKNKLEIDMERRQRKGDSLASIRRKRPMTVREAFTMADGECKFNSTILDIVLDQYTFGNKEVTRGNFVWRDGVKDTIVDFIPSENGRGYTSYLFPKPEMSNAFKYEGGIKVPANTDFFVAGADPFKIDVTKDRRNSRFGFGVFRKRDWNVDNPAIPAYEVTEHGIIKNHVTERYCYTYAFRPTTLDQACEDALMACVYYGCEVFPEMNVDYFERYMRRRGYGGYLFHKQDEVTKKYDKQAGDTTTVSVKADIYTFFSDHIERNGMREVHDDLVREWREIGNDMEEYDLFVGCGYAGLASRKISVTSLKGISINEIFRPYVYK